MPLLVHPMVGTLGVNGEAVELPRQTDREISDVDALLNFAIALRLDFAAFERDERSQRIFLIPKCIADQADNFTAMRGRQFSPMFLCNYDAANQRFIFRATLQFDRSD